MEIIKAVIIEKKENEYGLSFKFNSVGYNEDKPFYGSFSKTFSEENEDKLNSLKEGDIVEIMVNASLTDKGYTKHWISAIKPSKIESEVKQSSDFVAAALMTKIYIESNNIKNITIENLVEYVKKFDAKLKND